MTDRQIEIIRKSIYIIASKGIQGLTIKNLSKEIGISEAAIYRHFKSKTDILLAILENFANNSTFINHSLDKLDEDTFKKISLIFANIINLFSKEPSHISVIFSEEIFKNEDVLKKKITEIMYEKERAIENLLLEGQIKGEVRRDIDNKILALVVMGTFRFMVKQMDLRDEQENLQEENKKLINGLETILRNQSNF